MHRLVIDAQVLDFYKPVGDWKKENNSTAVVIEDRQSLLEYSDHRQVPGLMARWLEMLAREIRVPAEPEALIRAYARLHIVFVGIHPFWDGNGRVARLVSNLPLLEVGQPPIFIPRESRFDYLETLTRYTSTHGVPSLETPLIRQDALFDAFCVLCKKSWTENLSLVAKAHALQKIRDSSGSSRSESPAR